MADENPLADLKKRLEEGNNLGETQPGMDVHVVSPVATKVAEVKEVIKQHPDHPNAKVFERAIRGMRDTDTVMIDKVHLQSVLENKEVIVKRSGINTEEGPAIEIRQELGGDYKPPEEPDKAEATPTQPAEAAKSPPPVELTMGRRRHTAEPTEEARPNQ